MISVCWWVGAGIVKTLAACLPLPSVSVGQAQPAFALSWVHSVERTVWLETWRIEASAEDEQKLEMVQHSAQVKGSGAGIDPPEGAEWKAGWWVWAPQPALRFSEIAMMGASETVALNEAGHNAQPPWRVCVLPESVICRDLPSSFVLQSFKSVDK